MGTEVHGRGTAGVVLKGGKDPTATRATALTITMSVPEVVQEGPKLPLRKR